MGLAAKRALVTLPASLYLNREAPRPDNCVDKKAENTRAVPKRPPSPSLLALLRPYAKWVAALVALTIFANGLNLAVPKLIAGAIDDYDASHFAPMSVAIELFLVAVGVFVLTYFQSVVQTFASEKVARDLRNRLIAKISLHDYAFIQDVSPAKLLTNLTSDIDAVKNFVAQAIASIISSLFIIVGASILLLLTDWQLAAIVLTVIPVIGITFFLSAVLQAAALALAWWQLRKPAAATLKAG